MNIVIIFKAIYGIMAVVFSTVFIKDLRKHKFKHEKASPVISGFAGGLAYFCDTLGIGSYAIATAVLRHFKQIQDKNLPGTLNVTSVMPILLEAMIFISIIKVDPLTISLMVAGTCLGSWICASFIHKMPERIICLVISISLFIAATVLILKQFNIFTLDYAGGAIGLTGIKLAAATFCSIIIGVLGAMGIGCYAPFLATALTLGLSARATFPIMMSAAALAGGFASIKFIKIGNYERKVSFYMIPAAMVGVLIAAYIVKTIPLKVLNWVAICVIYHTSLTLFLNSYKKKTVVSSPS